ncbi:MarR family winged helix-turn-helix transcriptional regulator [Actinorhabdospora filicis]|nr:MarR family transcriptional regulator [Actinorhabdospora filicis]
MGEPTDVEVCDQWCATLRAVHVTSAALEHALEAEHGLGLSEFQVLLVLAGVEPGRAKMRLKDLEAKMYLSQSALSRTVARLHDAGLLTRAACELDRRALFVELSESGRKRYEDALPTHMRVLREQVAAV